MRVGGLSITPLRQENNQMVYNLRFFESRKGFTPKEQVVVEITEKWLKALNVAINRVMEASESSTKPER